MLGMACVLKMYQSSKNGGYLKILQDPFRIVDTWTFLYAFMGQYLLSTAELDNMEVMLASRAVLEPSSRRSEYI